jgi:hypothetical protein
MPIALIKSWKVLLFTGNGFPQKCQDSNYIWFTGLYAANADEDQYTKSRANSRLKLPKNSPHAQLEQAQQSPSVMEAEEPGMVK